LEGPWAGFIGAGFGLIYPILLLVFMTRPNVAAAFRPPPPRPAAIELIELRGG